MITGILPFFKGSREYQDAVLDIVDSDPDGQNTMGLLPGILPLLQFEDKYKVKILSLIKDGHIEISQLFGILPFIGDDENAMDEWLDSIERIEQNENISTAE